LSKKIRVVVVEDHALTRAGLRTALGADSGIEVAGEAEDGLSGVAEIERTKPDVAVVDIGLPGIDGIELTRRVRTAVPQTRIVILTMHDLDDEIMAALAAGADAYCVKASEPAGVITAVKVVAEGGAYFDPNIAHVVLRALGSAKPPLPPHDSPLTPRELEILRLIADGTGNQEIAERLHLGLGTVKGHIRDILEKMSANDRTQAAVLALRRGLI
jgi:DNA-binding NarL/FixJ family response regulator